MKNIGLLFLIAFIFFFLGQILWIIGLILEDPLFGNKYLEEWTINIFFTSCSIFGMVAGFRLYNQKEKAENS